MKRYIAISALIVAFMAGALYAEEGTPSGTPGSGISGAATPFFGESFQTDLATGAATMSVAITVPPGRKNMQPNLALSYSSNSGNGICGVGWAIPMNYIQRSTKKGIPAYDGTDIFMFVSSGSNAELVRLDSGEYRAKLESAFMRYIYDSGSNSWIVYDKSGTRYYFGSSAASRLEDEGKIYGWYLDRVEGVHGNYITYSYTKPADGQIYPDEIRYTGGVNLEPTKSILFNYDDARPDTSYSYRSGWKIATTRRLREIHVKLDGNIIWKYELTYTQSPDTDRSLLESVIVFDANNDTLPSMSKKFTYQRLEE